MIRLLLTFSAGMARRNVHQDIISSYPRVCEVARNRKRLQARALKSLSGVSIIGFSELRNRIFAFNARDVILVSGNVGDPLTFVAACGHRGLPLAVVYRTLDRAWRAMLRGAKVELLPVEDGRPIVELFRTFDAVREYGAFLYFIIDVPFKSRKTSNFLGYNLPISRLASAYAKRAKLEICSLNSRIVSAFEMHYNLLSILDSRLASMIASVEQTILQEPCQYRWTTSAIIFADPSARQEAMRFVPDVLQYRDQALASGAAHRGPFLK